MANRFSIYVLGAVLLLTACAPFSSRKYHDAPMNLSKVPAAPDYSEESNWAALPSRVDAADEFPENSSLPDRQSVAEADVFFIYPTLYTDNPKGRYPWNASVTDEKLNDKIDESTIKMQASVFNAAGRVFSPRYRQAHISAYYTNDAAKAKAAFDTAYADIRRAFDEFLRKHNEGRPIIIAGHSQGTTMAKRLVKEYFDGKPLAYQLVAAYLVGIPVEPDYFSGIKVCTTATQTGCFVSWRTWQKPEAPWTQKGESGMPPSVTPVVVNPLRWTNDSDYVAYEANPGGTLRKLKLEDDLVDAQIHEGILWINRPDFFGNRIIRMDNWHVADINLFYESIRINAKQRVESYLESLK